MGIFSRTTKLRWHRRIRRSHRRIEDTGVLVNNQLELLFVRRLNHLWAVRRFLAAWVLLLVFLSTAVFMQTQALGKRYQTTVPKPGGIYTEGILGSFTNANPLYASGPVDSSVSRLVFASLFKYDQKNNLVGDLAKDWSVNADGTVYTVTLKQHLQWQDGAPLTAQDVAFTYHTIQNPDAQSPLEYDWQDVKVTAKDDQTVVFTLPNALSSFPYSLTNGIVPEHILKDVPIAQLRSANFNTIKLVGSGPFRLDTIEVFGNTPETREERIALVPFEHYQGGTPKLARFIIWAIHTKKSLIKSFEDKELTAAVGLTELSDTLKKDKSIYSYSVPLTAEVEVFFKTTRTPFTDKKVRQALLLASNPETIINGLGEPVIPADEPLLRSQLGYDEQYAQMSNNVAKAEKLLDSAGWKLHNDGFRYKDDKRLSFNLFSENTSEYSYVSNALQKQWRRVGVDARVQLQSSNDLQYTISQHAYDALLYGISLGVDPDMFVYWDSTQAEPYSHPWLNLSEYQSDAADKSLANARIRANDKLRAVKYRPFLNAWHNDAPSLVLYQPRFLYLTNSKVYGFDQEVMNTSVGRYANVQNWMIKEGRGLKR